MSNPLTNADQHLYPMKKHWQMINIILGFWIWFWMIVNNILYLFLSIIFPRETWEKKVIPAFHKMMVGEAHSFLRISETGLTYRNWPWEEIRSTWSDVHCIQKGRWFGAVLYLRRTEIRGFSEFSIVLSEPRIPLSCFEGWTDGTLETDLRKHAPQLFHS